VLVEAFNSMLHECGARTTELEEINRTLQLETETRRRAEAGLREADRRKDEFLATLAHELRNPLAPMMNSLIIHKSAETDSAMAGRGLGILERQLAQLVRLVDDLLDVSRITSGKLTIRRELVALKSVVRNAVETVEPQLAARGLNLKLELPEQQVHLLADSSRLSQVLGNLLNNSI
jgi:signal transduction histidine kinase